MFPQFLIVLILASHIDGSALGVSTGNSWLNPNEKDLPTSRIVGGVHAPPGQAKHMVALLIGEFITTLLCGGSIITKEHILTAAHCIETVVVWGELLHSFSGVIGSHYWNSTEHLVRFTGFVIHEEWNFWTIKNDIGLLSTNDIHLSHRVAVIGLNFNWVGEEEESFATGWGTVGLWMPVPDKLKMLEMSTMDPQKCVEAVLAFDQLGWMAPAVDPALEICTFHSPGHGMCHGDSGSALVLKKCSTQIGIVSWGFPCAIGAPDMFVRVSGYKSWLLNHIGKHL